MPPDNVAPDIWFPNLGIYFERVPQHAFSVFGVDIYVYALFIIAGIVAGYFLAAWYARRTGQKPDDYLDVVMLGVPMAIVGLRIYYMAFNWEVYQGQPLLRAFFDFRGGGLAIYGGIIGALLAAAIMSIKKGIPFATIADTCAPSLLLGQVIGRFGNFFNREAFGGFTENIFAMRIRVDQARLPRAEMLEQAITSQGVQYLQVHPTFLYEAFFNFVLMILLMLYRPRKKFNGEIILLYMLGYGIIRFFIEGVRVDQLMFFGTGLPASQIMSVVFVVLSVVLIIAGHMRGRPVNRRRRRK